MHGAGPPETSRKISEKITKGAGTCVRYPERISYDVIRGRSASRVSQSVLMQKGTAIGISVTVTVTVTGRRLLAARVWREGSKVVIKMVIWVIERVDWTSGSA
jgi:hypothetical protein